MTIENEVASRLRGRTRRRLVPRGALAAEYLATYGSSAVAEYALAVRDVVEDCPGIGPVDTWRKLAERICRNSPGRHRDKWRKALSRHFTTESKGPPWRTVVLVVEHALPPERRNAALARFALLYEAAREEPPPTGETPRPADDDQHPAAQEQRASVRLRQENVLLRRQLAAVRGRLAASEAENGRLRAALTGSALRQQPRRPAEGPIRPAAQQRALRNDGHFPTTEAGPAARSSGRPPVPRRATVARPDTVTVGPPDTVTVGPPDAVTVGPPDAVTVGRSDPDEATWWIEGLWHRSAPEPPVGRGLPRPASVVGPPQSGLARGGTGRFPAPAPPRRPST